VRGLRLAVLLLCAIALLATACGSGSAGTSETLPDTSVVAPHLGGSATGIEHFFPSIHNWKAGMDNFSGTANDPLGLAQVILDGSQSKVTGVFAVVTLKSSWTDATIDRASDYLVAPGRLGAGKQGLVWVSKSPGLVAGGQKVVHATTTFGAVRLPFISADVLNQEAMAVSAAFNWVSLPEFEDNLLDHGSDGVDDL
jgi:hypothetical protein